MNTDVFERKIVTSICGCKSCINKKEDLISTEYQGKIIYFCEELCKSEFLENPQKFLKSDHTNVPFESLEDLPVRSNPI